MDSYSTVSNGKGKTSFSYKEHNEVQDFLKDLHLSQYIPVFIEEGFESLQAVEEITEEDLIALNVKRGHRRVIQRGIATLNGIPQSQALNVNAPTSSTVHQQKQQPQAPDVQLQTTSNIMRSKSNNGNNSSEGSSYTTSGYGSMSSYRQHQPQQSYESPNSSSQYASSTTPHFHHHNPVAEQKPNLIIQHHQPSIPPSTIQQLQKNKSDMVEGSRSSSFSSNDEEDNDDDDVNAPLKRKYRRHPKPDKNAPIKPPSAYIMFSNDARAQLNRDHNMSFVEIAKLVGDQWKNLSINQKQQYERTAMRAKDEYIDALNTYRQTEEHKNYQIYLNNFKSKQDATNRRIARLRKRAKRESPSSGSMADNSSNGCSNSSNIKVKRSDGSLGSSNSTDGGFNENDNGRSSSSSGSSDIYKVHLKNNPVPVSASSGVTGSTMVNNSSSEEQNDDSPLITMIGGNADQPIIEDPEEEDKNNGGECYSPQQKAPPSVDDNVLTDNNYLALS